MPFQRIMFNNRTIASVDGFMNTKRIKTNEMKELTTYVKFFGRSASVGCDIFVVDSVTQDQNFSGRVWNSPNILRASLWKIRLTDQYIAFKLSNAYGYRLYNPAASFKEFDEVCNKMISVLNDIS
jgi:hypothetical protein